jgi:high-affinity iron transporter
VTLPGFVGLWFAVFSTVEGVLAQAAAATLVIDSYLLAEHVLVRRPRARALTAELT